MYAVVRQERECPDNLYVDELKLEHVGSSGPCSLP